MMPEGFVLHRFTSLDSTNEEALRRGAVPGEAIIAETQTGGRGRAGRDWQSPPGNLYATLCAAAPVQGTPAHLAFVAALAVHGTLSALAPGCGFSLKWPNDVMANGRKLAGILIESGRAGYAVGIGINLVSTPSADTVRVPATDLRSASGLDLRPDDLLPSLCRNFGHWRDRLDGEGFAPLKTAWLASGHRIGDTIAASTGTGRIDGRFAGLDDSGALLLDDTTGTRHAIAAGDVILPGAS